MLSFFPKQISNKIVGTYLASLAVVSIVYMNYAMSFKFMLIGLMFVFCFSHFSNSLSVSWKYLSPKTFSKKLFWTAVVLRAAWVLFSYYFYIANTGQPFEWGAADSKGYHETAIWLSEEGWDVMWQYEFHRKNGVSDDGYEIYLFLVYSLFGPNIFITRLLKTIWGGLTCVLAYRLASRNFGESTGRMAGLFCAFMPNLIIYSGLHLKETEMLLLTVAFVERADYLLRSRKFNFGNIAAVALLALSLFFFRTVLGGVAVASFFTALVLSSEKVMKKGKRVLLIVVGLLFVAVIAGGTISTEIEQYWNNRGANQNNRRMEQMARGANWAKYATGAVMAPMVFVLPFATMVDVDEQYGQQLIHGGNFVKNFMGIFVILAFVYLVFVNKKKWRDHVLIGSFTIGYLLVVAMSAFASAERFLLPAVPFLLVFSAYGVSQLNARNFKFVKYWCVIVVLMEFAWAFFKLGSRGMVGF